MGFFFFFGSRTDIVANIIRFISAALWLQQQHMQNISFLIDVIGDMAWDAQCEVPAFARWLFAKTEDLKSECASDMNICRKINFPPISFPRVAEEPPIASLARAKFDESHV